MTKKTPVKSNEARRHLIEHAVHHAAHLLPAQGPITSFVHHNTLHAFEEQNFHDAVREASVIYGCEPYMQEDHYREKLSQRRILREDLQVALDQATPENVPVPGLEGEDRNGLRLAMLSHSLKRGTTQQIHWTLTETKALSEFGPGISAEAIERLTLDARRWLSHAACQVEATEGGASIEQSVFKELKSESIGWFEWDNMDSWTEIEWMSWTLKLMWKVACIGSTCGKLEQPTVNQTIRLRDIIWERYDLDTDQQVQEALIPFCAAYLDQGLSHWKLPQRDQGFLKSFHALYSKKPMGAPAWMEDVALELNRVVESKMDPIQSIQESLEKMGVEPEGWDAYVSASALALRGWAGMIHQVESRPDKVTYPVCPGSLNEFLAVRLILDRCAADAAMKDLGLSDLSLKKMFSDYVPTGLDRGSLETRRAFLIFQVAQIRGWEPSLLLRLSKEEWSGLIQELEAFNDFERRKIFHLAYERRFRVETLDAVQKRAEQSWKAGSDQVEFQVVCCIDDREESFRRGLEEKYPEAETFGAAGFFSVPMYYRAITDAHFTPLCPPVIVPKHYVRETASAGKGEDHEKFQKIRNWIGSANHRLHLGAQGLVGGIITGILGAVATAPLVAGVMAPRSMSRLRKLAHSIVAKPPTTDVVFERTSNDPGTKPDQLGFKTEEMANMVERLLNDIGLSKKLAPLVVIVGHGSSSLNNPHEAAYDCGACGGARGGPNARVFALMANDTQVRKLLKERGIDIPDSVWFLGGYHNTCDDSMTYFDLNRAPVSHRARVEKAMGALDDAREYNALERCRRFRSAPLGISEKKALEHVEGRAEHLAQPRPEYGHSTNAICYVGRRDRLRGLFMDRRAFLTSYDPTTDSDDAAILTRILQAVVPVCGGINLEYYFSYTDPAGWGCGTKLPHNVTSLLGVMDGAGSDLRTGLTWQMVEIHESVRILFIIEASVTAMRSILEKDPNIKRMFNNEWTLLSVLDPESPAIHFYQNGEFVLHRSSNKPMAQARTSAEWIRGWRDHLGYALIRSGMKQSNQTEI